GISAVLNEGVTFPSSVSRSDLRKRLEAKYAATPVLAQPSEGVLEAVNRSQGVQLVDHEPEPLRRTAPGPLVPIHGFEDCKAHPRRNGAAKGGYLVGAVRHEQHAGLPAAHPFAHREGRMVLLADVFQRGNRGAGHRADRIEHSAVVLVEKR